MRYPTTARKLTLILMMVTASTHLSSAPRSFLSVVEAVAATQMAEKTERAIHAGNRFALWYSVFSSIDMVDEAMVEVY